jgi:signal transduction histidine kinase
VGEIWAAIIVVLISCVSLVWRRSAPVTVLVIAAAPSFLLSPSLAPTGHMLLAFALYAVAVYRSSRACWVAFGVTSLGLTAYGAVTYMTEVILPVYTISGAVSGIVTVLIGALIGVNVGNRRRYLAALIDRSRQLLVERDQLAQLAAAAERTRIAREMHDIVSHSLTVIVALSEGAMAATTVDRARQANRGAADTARAALAEMRAMLGVLRDGNADEGSPLEPMEPVDPAVVVAAAQRAGYPVVAEFIGSTDDVARSVRFALGRIVQEAVTNAMRHAPSATRVRVRVQTDSRCVRVSVDNDGVPPSGPGESGFGLRGLRERVEHVGGTLRSGRSQTGTWMLEAELPLTPEITEGPA